jgi:ATP-dependent DNA ligase
MQRFTIGGAAPKMANASISLPVAATTFSLSFPKSPRIYANSLTSSSTANSSCLTSTESQNSINSEAAFMYCQHVGESGEKLFQASDQLGLEGVIGKKGDSPYRAGRTTNWVKIKTSHGRHIDEERAKWNE